jgi:hypothetical protein
VKSLKDMGNSEMGFITRMFNALQQGTRGIATAFQRRLVGVLRCSAQAMEAARWLTA